MNQYETVFILTPVLSDEQMKETVAKFKKILTTGFYCLLEFKGEPTIVDILETGYRREEKVIRYITVKEDKHMVAYSEKRRAKLGKKEEA